VTYLLVLAVGGWVLSVRRLDRRLEL
jgi:hypothetical protein